MPIICAEQNPDVFLQGKIDKVIRSKTTNEPKAVEFTLIDTDGTHKRAYAALPAECDEIYLQQDSFQTWKVLCGAVPGMHANGANLCFVAVRLAEGVWIENIKSLD